MFKLIRLFFLLVYKIVYLDIVVLVFKFKLFIIESNNFYNLYLVSIRINNFLLGIYINKIVNEVRCKIVLLIDVKENEVIFIFGVIDLLNKFV